jgi:hypothetical protein
MKVLIILSGGGSFVSEQSEVVFKGGDCVLVPAAYEGVARFANDSQYLTVLI